MLREMCKAKIHAATVTETNLNYNGSITIDNALLEDREARNWKPKIILVDGNNKLTETLQL